MSAIIISMAFLLLICCSTICLSISIAAYLYWNKKPVQATEEIQITPIIKEPEELMNPRSKQVYEFYKDNWVETNNTTTGIQIRYEVRNDKLNMLIVLLNGDGYEAIPVQTAQLLPKDKDLYELLAAKTAGIDGQIIVDKGNNNLRIFKIIDKNRMELTGFKNGLPIPTTVYIRNSEIEKMLRAKMEQEAAKPSVENEEQSVTIE